MKTTNALTSFKNALIVLLGACIILAASSCSKNASTSVPAASTAVTESDAATVVTDGVTPQTQGMVSQVNDACGMAGSTYYPCGQSFDSSIIRSSASGAAVTYALNLAWGWKLTCMAPANFAAWFKGSSSYSEPAMSAIDSSNGSFTITGIGASSSYWVFNSTYTRNGSKQSNIGYKNSFTSTLTITSTNIQVSKTTQQIVSGTASVSIIGASASGRSYSFSGTLTFNGSQTATLVITGGGTYQIKW